MIHKPVLLKEVIEILNPEPGEFFIDGTFGGGGHATAILEKIGPMGKLLGIDWDERAVQSFKFQASSPKNLILVQGNYADIPEILKKEKKADPSIPLRVNGLIVDLGLSSDQLESSGRGFSFQKDEPLDMRFDAKSGRQSAGEIINSFNEKDLADIFWKYGEERSSRRIAKAIVEARRKQRIKTTIELAEIIKKAVLGGRGKIHPATKIFQALRIYVNGELDNLESLLKNLENITAKGGRAGIISFHSLEDRLVKNYFRDLAKSGKAEILTKKPVIPAEEEIKINSRARSAKLRAIKFNL